MVKEVNKIIYNLIIAGKEVCIGDVGTLLTVRYAAHRASKKSLTPPYRIVTFTTEQRGISLEEEIARIAGIEQEKAHEIFEQWLSEVVEGDTLKIEGVGSLRHDKFTTDEALLTTLNPQGRAPIRLKPKANVGLYVFATLCMLFALVVAGYVYVDNNGFALFDLRNTGSEELAVAQNVTDEPAIQVETPATEVIDTETIDNKAEVPTTELVVQEQQPAEMQEQPKATDKPKPQQVTENGSDEIRSTEVGRSYVALGVFSTIENAKRAIRNAQKRGSDLQCSVYHYGNKFMVSLYDAPSRSECKEYARSIEDKFKDLWIYTRK